MPTRAAAAAWIDHMTTSRSVWRSLTVALSLVVVDSARALTPENRARLRQTCETPLKEAPADFTGDVCECYVGTIEKRYPNIETENYARIRDDVRRILPDCFAEAVSRRDPSVNSKRGWAKMYRAAFIESCRGAATKGGASAETAATFCECTARETEKRFPDSLSAEKYSRHLLADAPTAIDRKASDDVSSICLDQAPDENEEVASVEYQIIRNMRKGMTRANAARNVLRGFSGYYLMLTDARSDGGAPRVNAEFERTKGLVAEAGRLYVEACGACAGASVCERDRIEAMMPHSEDKQSPCGIAKAPGEERPPPMSNEERLALERDAAPYVASMARGMLMGLVRSRREGNAVSEKDIREAQQGYLQLCERCTTRKACAADIDLILAGRPPDKRPWSSAVR
jgi:hypothetical protein